jgi:hypothetical protein
MSSIDARNNRPVCAANFTREPSATLDDPYRDVEAAPLPAGQSHELGIRKLAQANQPGFVSRKHAFGMSNFDTVLDDCR